MLPFQIQIGTNVSKLQNLITLEMHLRPFLDPGGLTV